MADPAQPRRDPRVDPKPGDVLRGHRSGKDRLVNYSGPGPGGRIVLFLQAGRSYERYLWTWRTWAKNAEVIHAAD